LKNIEFDDYRERFASLFNTLMFFEIFARDDLVWIVKPPFLVVSRPKESMVGSLTSFSLYPSPSSEVSKMPWYEIVHVIPLTRDPRERKLSQRITDLHAQQFMSPNFFVNVHFPDASNDWTNVGGKAVTSPSVFAIFQESLDLWLELGDESDVEMI
jgi:Putative oxalocrotonate tautomerase enzyme